MDTQHTPSPASAGAVSAETQREKAWREAGERIQREDMGLDKLAPPAPTPAVPVEAKQEPLDNRLRFTDLELHRLLKSGQMPNAAAWLVYSDEAPHVTRLKDRYAPWSSGLVGAVWMPLTHMLASPTAGTPAPAVPCPRGHNWHDYGQLGGRNVSWCPRCDTLAFTGSEPDHAAAPAAPAPLAELTDERIDAAVEGVFPLGDDPWHTQWLAEIARPIARAIEREVRSTSSAGTPEAVSDEQILMIGKRALEKCIGTDAQHIYIAREVERHLRQEQ